MRNAGFGRDSVSNTPFLVVTRCPALPFWAHVSDYYVSRGTTIVKDSDQVCLTLPIGFVYDFRI